MQSVFLDEFGHIGPYISLDHKRFNTSPVFGVAGFYVHHTRVRDLAHWFYKLKCSSFEEEISESTFHPSAWEKKGNELFTHSRAYKNKRRAYSVISQVKAEGGRLFFYGMEKPYHPEGLSAASLYSRILREALIQLEKHFKKKGQVFQVIIDQHNDRSKLMTAASKVMYQSHGVHSLVELPYQVESHLYSTVQMADWIASIIGSIAAGQSDPAYKDEYEWAEKYFGQRMRHAATASTVKLRSRAAQSKDMQFVADLRRDHPEQFGRDWRAAGTAAPPLPLH